MDGNGRWATKQGLGRIDGHRAGLRTARDTVVALSKMGIPFVTLFSFSTENWKRPADEISGLMKLLEIGLDDIARDLKQHNIRLKHLGRLDNLSPLVRFRINDIINRTRDNNGTVASMAFDYGGRSEIVDAVKRMLKSGTPLDQVNEHQFERYLYDPDLPEVDLLIRTSGEQRISNFLLWQSAFAELYFTETLWPDFDQIEIDKAIEEYVRRSR
ncbi:undecaprenyl diphosphate synthase [Dehalogenimonas formicexedens]|uniref:Isoprenyl transferase n=2 Tax=Dehalogenimonas formicexedens TaxID=1839801 RepID=A0A1P8F9I7_9CHLR|nr:undecaprenyl diphosphate synthase [Dehalogenimonas formicexedens]